MLTGMTLGELFCARFLGMHQVPVIHDSVPITQGIARTIAQQVACIARQRIQTIQNLQAV